MAKLLKIQQEEVSEYKPDSLKAFGISLLCSLLDIFESDIAPDEMREIERLSKDWAVK